MDVCGGEYIGALNGTIFLARDTLSKAHHFQGIFNFRKTEHGSNCEIERSIRSYRDPSCDSLFSDTICLIYMNVFQTQHRVFCWLYHALILRHSNTSSMSVRDHQTICPIHFILHCPPKKHILLVTSDVSIRGTQLIKL